MASELFRNVDCSCFSAPDELLPGWIQFATRPNAQSSSPLAVGPLAVELKLLFASLPGLGDGYEVRTEAAFVNNLVGNAVLVEAKMCLWLLKRGVQGRVVNDRLLACACRRWRHCVRHLLLRRGAFT